MDAHIQTRVERDILAAMACVSRCLPCGYGDDCPLPGKNKRNCDKRQEGTEVFKKCWLKYAALLAKEFLENNDNHTTEDVWDWLRLLRHK